MSNLPIRTYQRKNAAKQTSILYKNPSIISRTNIQQVKSSKNNNIEVKEKIQNGDDTLEYDPFDTTFDRLAKDAVLPPIPPVSGRSNDSWYDSSDNSLQIRNSSSTSTVLQEAIRTKIRTPIKRVRKRKNKKDAMIAEVNKITKNKYPKTTKMIKEKGYATSINEMNVDSEKSSKLKGKYNRRKKNDINKVEESKKNGKHIFSQISNHSSNSSSIIDHQLLVESVSDNNYSKVIKTNSQSSDVSETTEAMNTEEVPVKYKKSVWKMKIVLSPNKKKILQQKKRKSKSQGISFDSSCAINDVRVQKRKKLKNMDSNASALNVNHSVDKPEINCSSNVNDISMNSSIDGDHQINRPEVNSSANNINNISMNSSNDKLINASKPLSSININALAHSTTYPNSNKSSDKLVNPLESLTTIKAVAHSTPYPNSKKSSENKPGDPLESTINIKVEAQSAQYINSNNSLEFMKPTIIVNPCYVKLERYKKDKTKQYNSKEFKEKEICIPEFSHLPVEENIYEHIESTKENSSQTIIRPCSIKISRINADNFLKPTSTRPKTNGFQSDSRNWTKQFGIKDCSINLSEISPFDYKKIKLRESNLPTRKYHSLTCSTPLEKPVKKPLMKIRFSPIDSLTSIKTRRQKYHVEDKPLKEDLSKEKTNEFQDISTVKKNLHTYYNTSDVEESKEANSNIKDSQESLSMDEQKTMKLKPKSNKIQKYLNSPEKRASDHSQDSIYSATTINYNSSSGTNPSKKVLGLSSDADASQSLFGDSITYEEKLLSSNDNTKNKTDTFHSRLFPYVTRRKAKKNSLQVQMCPALESDISTVNAKASHESSNTEDISFEDSSLSPTEIMENSQKIDTDTSTSNLLGFSNVNSVGRINCSNESLSDGNSQETEAESLPMDSEYSKKSQETLEYCDSIKMKDVSVSEESVKSEEPKKHVQDDKSLLRKTSEKMDVDDAADSNSLIKPLHNVIMLAKSRRNHRNCDLQLTPITESPFRGFPKEESRNGSQNIHLSLVDVSSKISENYEKFNVSNGSINEKTLVFLKPGKLWARSLSILNNIQRDADLDTLCVNKGKKWRQSVQAILAMQQTPRKSSIPGNTGVIQSCLKENDNDKEPETRHGIRPSLNCLPNSEVNTTLGTASPGRHIRRISIRVVPDNKKFSHIKHSPFLEAYGLTSSKKRQTFSQLSTQIAPLKETAVYNVQYKDAALETIETGPIFTAREVILQRCNQDDYIPFEECFPKSYLERCRKIGEGVYGEVFVYEGEEENCVIKIIPIEGSELVNGETQKKFSEILSEIVIARELHNLRFNDKYNSSSYVEVKNIRCIVGKYPEKLVELWKIYDEEKNSDNDCPSMFNDNQLYIVLELGHGGQDLEAFVFQNASQSHAVFIQTAVALAVAEKSLEFEHRDLHWGNILISRTDETEVRYKLNDAKISFKTKGVQAAIIDFTLSRMSYQGCCIFNDLALDPALFAAQGEYQFEIYRLMRDKVNNDWQKFEPYTNILWLHYTLDKMITAVRYKNKKTKVHKNGIGQLQELKDVVLNYNSAFDFVTNCEQVLRLQCGDSRDP